MTGTEIEVIRLYEKERMVKCEISEKLGISMFKIRRAIWKNYVNQKNTVPVAMGSKTIPYYENEMDYWVPRICTENPFSHLKYEDVKNEM